ncbi:hypothetical protein [Duganella callida]|uniref:Uncharacterized protein n=1 Tax=Duganella callida TaxID=2561932 RepID=A0A4Y9S820_9BURK|nr:hypothetical protein [Duganella callida]TFW17707.1 hypothetical protein E4L98_20035 [Duganella callida]
MIHIKKTIRLLLPFQRYSLRVSHRLLDSLGGVSRFLMRALDKQLSLEQLAEVTGLSPRILVQQLRFLEQHGFVATAGEGGAPTLAQRGARMVEVENMLRGFEPEVWLDSFTLHRKDIHLLLTPQPELLLHVPDEADFGDASILRLPERKYSYRHFDEAGRLRRLMERDVLGAVLEYHWPEAAALIGEEMEHWEYTLQGQGDDGARRYLPVAYAPDEFRLRPHGGNADERVSLPLLLLPVLGLTHRYTRAEGFPWKVPVPPATTLYLERLSYETLPGFVPADPANATNGVAMPASACVDGPLPEQLQGVVTPPGLSAVLSVSLHHSLCHMDHLELSRQMQKYHDIRLFSSNYRHNETEPA